jgi:hypothetical protein
MAKEGEKGTDGTFPTARHLLRDLLASSFSIPIIVRTGVGLAVRASSVNLDRLVSSWGCGRRGFGDRRSGDGFR